MHSPSQRRNSKAKYSTEYHELGRTKNKPLKRYVRLSKLHLRNSLLSVGGLIERVVLKVSKMSVTDAPKQQEDSLPSPSLYCPAYLYFSPCPLFDQRLIMCCRRKAERVLEIPVQPRRGCCRSRRQERIEELVDGHISSKGAFEASTRGRQPVMAAMLAVGIGIGAEKLSRKISDKRLEKKEKKAAAVCIPFNVTSISLTITLTGYTEA